MNANAAPPSFLADRRRVAAVRSSQPPDRPTARPAATLADVVRLARDRVYLPACLGALGWDHGTDLRVHVDAGHGVSVHNHGFRAMGTAATRRRTGFDMSELQLPAEAEVELGGSRS